MSHQTSLPAHRRARAASDKELRRGDLLAAARAAVLAQPLQDIRLADVAASAGISKAAVYLYHPSKEALFLALLIDELAAWFADLAQAPAHTPEAMGMAVATSWEARPVLRRLYAAMHGVLEHTDDVDTVVHFKRQLLGFATAAARVLPDRCPWLPAQAALPFLLQLHVVLVGLSESCTPAPAVEAAFEQDPALQTLRVDLIPTCAALVGALARALARPGESP